MKIVTIVGARPQFIKAAVVSRKLWEFCEETIIHTGQHYDYNMSDIFFEELEIPKPNYNLGISGGTHGKMTGEMLIKIEEVLLQEQPNMVLVYGDTNSTMAGALAAVKLNIPICHVEAGARLGTLSNPEEVNRITTDHVSSLLACCTESAINFLRKEGKTRNVYLVGDPMYDAFLFYGEKVGDNQQESLVDLNGLEVELPTEYYYMTCHRQENAGSDEVLLEILDAANSLEAPCVYPVHPRNQARVARLINKYDFKNVITCKPVGYLMSVYMTLHCKKVITDSGGLQREAFFAGKQCVTVFDYVVWPETMVDNRNQLARPDKKDILDKLSAIQHVRESMTPFGDGDSATKIAKLILDYCSQ